MPYLNSNALTNLRRDLDSLLYRVEGHLATSPDDGREMGIVRVKLQEAKMWAGQALGVRGSELPERYRDFCPERMEHRGQI